MSATCLAVLVLNKTAGDSQHHSLRLCTNHLCTEKPVDVAGLSSWNEPSLAVSLSIACTDVCLCDVFTNAFI